MVAVPAERKRTALDISNEHGGKKGGLGYMINCPCHEDSTPSLCVWDGDNDTILVKDFGQNCDWRKIKDALHLNGQAADGTPYIPKQKKASKPKPEPGPIVATYDYTDENGKLVYQVTRHYPPKDFRQRQPDGKGGWIKSITKPPVKLYPFRLSELLAGIKAGKNVYVPEGEKDANTLVRLGLVATTNNGGATNESAWPQIATYFTGADVVLVPDNDTAGEKHIGIVEAALKPYAKSISVARVPAPYKDVTEWVEARGDGVIADLLVGIAEWTPASATEIRCTDLGNARRMIKLFGPDIHYEPKSNRWMLWDGTRWPDDETGRIHQLATRTVASIYTEAAAATNDDQRKEVGKWAVQSESAKRLDSMVSLARWEPGIAISVSSLDANGWALTCKNGSVDLKTGALREPNRDDLNTKLIPVAYDPAATCPRWLAFLDRIMAGNQRTVDYLQKCVGYSLTGDVSEQRMFFLHGAGANGKSTFAETILALLGDYSQRLPIEVLTDTQRTGQASPDRARLPGARLVVTNETTEGRGLNEPLVKDLTGGDTLNARPLFSAPFDFKPTHKLWMYGNHKPIVSTDAAMWRRIDLIRFNVTIPEAERDAQLGAKLREELPGILAWAVQGCLRWQKEGLIQPPEVKADTAAYRAEMDIVADFLDTRCKLLAAVSTSAGALYAAYKAWCETSGEKPYSQRKFALVMTERGFQREHTNRGNVYLGIGLIQEEADHE